PASPGAPRRTKNTTPRPVGVRRALLAPTGAGRDRDSNPPSAVPAVQVKPAPANARATAATTECIRPRIRLPLRPDDASRPDHPRTHPDTPCNAARVAATRGMNGSCRPCRAARAGDGRGTAPFAWPLSEITREPGAQRVGNGQRQALPCLDEQE